jgi:hypothetical protein
MQFAEVPNSDTDLEPTFYTFDGGDWKRIDCRARNWWRIGSERTKVVFGIEDHPGGAEYKGKTVVPFEYKPEIMPPISHILRFWTSSAMLEIKISDYLGWPGYGADIGSDTINNPANGETIGHIHLDPEWLKAHSGLAEFIVISSAVKHWGEAPTRLDDIGLSVLLIEWKHGVAYRVGMCSSLIDRTAWRGTKPMWKLISLA